MLPEVNPREKIEILDTLNKFKKRYQRKKSLRKMYNKHYITFWFTIFFITLIVVILVLIIKNLVIFEFSLVFSIIAFIFSFITLISRVRGYPVDDLIIKKIKDDEDYFELSFSIQNCGHGKLKLNFAFYIIEEIESDIELTSFLQCDIERMDMYMEELITRVKSDVIKVYSLKAITKSSGVFFTHNDVHTERRLHKFDRNKIYMITFLFWTSKKILYYNSKYLKL